MQLRMLSLVGMLAVVMLLMHRARDPKNYAWMGFQRHTATAPRSPADTVDTVEVNVGSDLGHIAPRNGPTDQPVVVRTFGELPGIREELAEGAENTFQQTRAHLWSSPIERLDWEDHDRLAALLLAGRTGTAVAEGKRADLAAMWQRLDAAWNRRIQQARQALATEADEPTAAASDSAAILDRLEATWQTETRPAVTAVLEGSRLNSDQLQSVSEFQELLDHLALQEIQDNTIHRGVENRAWFRMLEILNSAAASDVASSSLGEASYLQLFQQPSFYRGKVITIRGAVKGITCLDAPQNPWGITQYYRLTLFPAGGPAKAILAYCLSLPAEFPAVASGEDRKIDESVEISGFFFKRFVYRSEGGLNTAPLLLAKVPIWKPVSVARTTETPGTSWLLVGSVLASCVAGVVVWIAYRQGKEPSLQAIARAARERRELQPRVAWDIPAGIDIDKTRDTNPESSGH